MTKFFFPQDAGCGSSPAPPPLPAAGAPERTFRSVRRRVFGWYVYHLSAPIFRARGSALPRRRSRLMRRDGTAESPPRHQGQRPSKMPFGILDRIKGGWHKCHPLPLHQAAKPLGYAVSVSFKVPPLLPPHQFSKNIVWWHETLKMAWLRGFMCHPLATQGGGNNH